MGNIYERVKTLCAQNGYAISTLCGEITGSKGNLPTWKKDSFVAASLDAIADKFNVSVDYLLGRTKTDSPDCPFNSQSAESVSNIKVSPHFVAFIDILGTQSLVKSNNEALLQNMVEITRLAYDLVSKSQEFVNQTLGIKIFSDNVVIYTPVDKDNYVVGLQALCVFVGFFQYLLLKHYKLYVRGGITIGEFFANEKFIYGQALNDAYNIEEKIAIYPRIVLSSQLIEQISIRNLDNEFYGVNKCLTYCHFDGCHYVNYLSFQTSDEIKELLALVNSDIHDLYSKMKNAGEASYLRILNINNEKIMQKYKQTQNFIQSCHTQFVGHRMNIANNTFNAQTVSINGDNSTINATNHEQYNIQYDSTFLELLSVWNKLSESKKEKLLIIAKELL